MNDGQIIEALTSALRALDAARICACWGDAHQVANHRTSHRIGTKLVERVVLEMLSRVTDPPIQPTRVAVSSAEERTEVAVPVVHELRRPVVSHKRPARRTAA